MAQQRFFALRPEVDDLVALQVRSLPQQFAMNSSQLHDCRARFEPVMGPSGRSSPPQSGTHSGRHETSFVRVNGESFLQVLAFLLLNSDESSGNYFALATPTVSMEAAQGTEKTRIHGQNGERQATCLW
jgi:hypothetical protein